MPVTKLDPACALVVIDLQKGIVDIPTVHPAAEIVARSAQLARAFRKKRLPVVLVHVTGRLPHRTDSGPPKFPQSSEWAEFVAELALQPGDHIVEKKSWGAFLGTTLDDYLRQHGITQIVLTGIATSMGVESTARSAFDLGYNIAFVLDAMTDRDADSHRHAIERIFPRLGETGATEDVLALLK